MLDNKTGKIDAHGSISKYLNIILRPFYKIFHKMDSVETKQFKVSILLLNGQFAKYPGQGRPIFGRF
jgi:hypothetical protein